MKRVHAHFVVFSLSIEKEKWANYGEQTHGTHAPYQIERMQLHESCEHKQKVLTAFLVSVN